jgi:integrase
MIRSGLARRTINARVNRIRRVIKWAASMGMIAGQVYQDLKTLDGLHAGRSEAKESPKVGPVSSQIVEATLPYMSRPVAAMVRFQLLTGCRVGEVLGMRGGDLRTESTVWELRPAKHKNSWREQSRVIMVGPKAQEVLRPFLKSDPEAYLFDPRDVVRELKRAKKGGRSPRTTADQYDRRTYRQAVVRACRKAKLKPWSPLQLRHTRADEIERLYGIAGSQVVLGHAKPDTTLIYLERDLEQARQIMLTIG